MPDYSKTIIYKLCCKDTSITDIYIGSTCNFHRRTSSHKYSCICSADKNHNLKVYQFIREHGGWENWTMIMIHEASVENKLQKEKLEREFIDKLKPSLNKQLPTRTMKEYQQDNKEKLAEQKKLYYESNKEKTLEYVKKWSAENKEKILQNRREKFDCECGGKYTKGNKSIHMKTKKHQDYISSLEE